MSKFFVSRGELEYNLASCLWVVDRDSRVCAHRLEQRAEANSAGDCTEAEHHLLCAITALRDAQRSLAAAEHFAAQLTRATLRPLRVRRLTTTRQFDAALAAVKGGAS